MRSSRALRARMRSSRSRASCKRRACPRRRWRGRRSASIDQDENTAAWGLWPTVTHTKMGRVRVDGLPAHLSKTDWKIERGGPCLGEHTELVLNRVLGMSADDVAKLRAEGVV